MPNTTFDVANKDRSRLAQALPIDPLTGKSQRVEIYDAKVKFDCGGSCAYSTAGDYVRFGQMLLNGGSIDGKRVLGPQTVAFMCGSILTLARISKRTFNGSHGRKVFLTNSIKRQTLV